MALAERAQAEGITVSSLVAQLLGDAVGEEPHPEPAADPDPLKGTGPGEEMLTRREAERLRWEWAIEAWQREMTDRQARLESSLAALDHRLAEVLERVQVR